MIRFVEENAPAGKLEASKWRGVIRHVQSREEERFTRVEELLAFMSHFVDLESDEDDVSNS